MSSACCCVAVSGSMLVLSSWAIFYQSNRNSRDGNRYHHNCPENTPPTDVRDFQGSYLGNNAPCVTCAGDFIGSLCGVSRQALSNAFIGCRVPEVVSRCVPAAEVGLRNPFWNLDGVSVDLDSIQHISIFQYPELACLTSALYYPEFGYDCRLVVFA